MLQLSWYQGVLFILFVSYQLFFGCFLGTYLAIKVTVVCDEFSITYNDLIFTSQNEQFQREIYNVSWYKLSIVNQKSLRFLLEAAQEPVCLTLVFAPLNMPTFLQVYKTIYSIFTMLLTVRDE